MLLQSLKNVKITDASSLKKLPKVKEEATPANIEK
jgi:hypothetical protein